MEAGSRSARQEILPSLPSFMELMGSLPRSWEPTTGPYLGSHESGSHFYTLFH